MVFKDENMLLNHLNSYSQKVSSKHQIEEKGRRNTVAMKISRKGD